MARQRQTGHHDASAPAVAALAEQQKPAPRPTDPARATHCCDAMDELRALQADTIWSSSGTH